MKKFILFFLCSFLIFSLAGCELPTDDEPTPSSSVTGSSPTEPSTLPENPNDTPPTQPTVPQPSVPQPTESQPSTPEPSTPQPSTPQPSTPQPTQPAPDPEPEPTPDPQPDPDPLPEPEPEPDFLESFMATHNSGKKYSFTVEQADYEISLNPATGIFTVLRKETVRCEGIDLSGGIYYQFGKETSVDYTYYYLGALTSSAGDQFSCRFDGYHMAISIPSLSKSEMQSFRNFVWDNIYQSKWQEFYLTQEECELWDGLLSGQIRKYTHRYPENLTLSGSAELPLTLKYIYYNGDPIRSVDYKPETIVTTSYAYAGAYSSTEYSHGGKRLSGYTRYTENSYSQILYDEDELPKYEIFYTDDGRHFETSYVRSNGILTKTVLTYSYDKVDGLRCTERLIDVFRYNPDNIADETWVSSHKYNKDNKLITYFLYNDRGRLTESMVSDDAGIETRTVNTYEDDLLVKSVVSVTEGLVTTQEYRYENGKLQRI